ncbi:DNA helicase IV [Vibrio olivae]|uniref:DNA 3'-5' helicase n=1 Tax=Vibrio olivae TaxID=1243002 RepID=A0ABV5HRB0_9VIBR
MQLSANKTAKFFIQNEYHQVKLDHDVLVIASDRYEERIPFNVWNGKIKVKRGLIWTGLQFFANTESNNIQRAWMAQGFNWEESQRFAQYALERYEHWHTRQCEQLNKYLPEWEQELYRLRRLPFFLSHSQVEKWLKLLYRDFELMNMSLEEACNRIPERITPMLPWIEHTDQTLKARNDEWIERERSNWEVLFSQLESSPLNLSQQQAVLLNDDNNLVLAGAGSGKTSVLMARVAYLLQSHLAQSNQILMLAFGRDAASEMSDRLQQRIGMSAEGVVVNTFHQLGLSILKHVDGPEVTISPLALDDNQRHAWCIDWLKKHWMTPTNFKRWQKHLAKWPIAYLAGDDELGSQVENPKLIAWLDTQLMQLAAMGLGKKDLQEKLVNHDQYTRLNSELSLVWPCYQAWQQMLKETGHIDFNVMITRATQYVKRGKFIPPWTFIMIDEYQDISPQRLALVEALCERNKKQQTPCVLFAVGDDWQSIYQFAGSDVDLTTGFARRFPNSTIHYLDTTYRFNDQLGAVANRFIQCNPHQLPKELKSHKQQKQRSVCLTPTNSIEKVLDQLNRKAKDDKSVLLLGRNHYHKPDLLSDWKKQFAKLSIEFMTCHASKGKEADYVFVLSVDEGQFPSKVKNVHMDGALTQGNDDYEFAEERRLFYVALTRAKQRAWVTYNGSGSVFVKELLEENYPVSKQR